MKKNTIRIGDEELTNEMIVEIQFRHLRKIAFYLMVTLTILFLGTVLGAISFLMEVESPLPFQDVSKIISSVFLTITLVKSEKEIRKYRKSDKFKFSYRGMLSLRDRLKPLLITILYCIAAILLYIYWGPIPGLPSGFSIQLIIHLGIVVLAVSIFVNRQPGKQQLFQNSI